MILKRYYLGCLAHASYLVGDEETRVAAVIDPQRDIDQYLEDARAEGLEIRYVFLTHFHADFVAGHIELRDATGARIYLGAKAEAAYEFTPLRDHDVVEFGRVRLSVLETPGHTPEGISILLFDLDRSDRDPYAVFTGDTLFIGDVGRPDLLASIGVTADQLADMLYDSLTQKLLKLPDATLVYPAHGAGSLCGKQLSDEAYSTIGEQRKYNYALQPMSREEFKRMVTADQPEAPDYFVHDAMMNREERASLEKSLARSLRAISLDEMLAAEQQGAQLLDTRDPADFAALHLRNSINISLDGKFATWAGTVLSKDRPIAVIAEPGREEESVMRLGRIGFDQVVGYLRDGAAAVEARPELVGHTERVTAAALDELLSEAQPPLVLDVRTAKEWRKLHIDGSLNIPLNQLVDRLNEVPRDRSIVVHCQSGYRSSIGASLLERGGVQGVRDLVGGIAAWTASKLPTAEEVTA